ncbi:MAG: hypothetical protein Q7R49_00475 [Candidatus Daviesbacteria bacterium]|nr:hypothetical protein [Candidatus Daviesbacteria bacterium]
MGIYSNDQYLHENDQNSLWDGIKHNGVVSGCAVTASSPVAMTVELASGVLVVNGTYVTISASTPVISVANGTYPRKDIITVNSSGTVTVTAGTADQAIPSANTGVNTNNPIPADIPSNQVIIAEIWVAAATTTIATAAITDKRVFIVSSGVLTGSLANRPAASSATRSVMYIMQATTGAVDEIQVCLKIDDESYGWYTYGAVVASS